MDLSIENIIQFKGKVDYRPFVQRKFSQPVDALKQHFDFTVFANLTMCAETPHDLQLLTYTLSRYLGFDHAAIAAAFPKTQDKFLCYHIFSQPNHWINYYQKNLMFIDPFTNWCLTKARPHVWQRHHRSDHELFAASPLMLAAISDFSVDDIITIPCRGSLGEIGSLRLLNFSHKHRNKEEIVRLLPGAMACGTYLLDALNRIMRTHSHENSICATFTVRELEVLKWISIGLSASDIGERLYISENTVLSHTKKLYRKLQVNNRTQAIARAAAMKLLDL